MNINNCKYKACTTPLWGDKRNKFHRMMLLIRTWSCLFLDLQIFFIKTIESTVKNVFKKLKDIKQKKHAALSLSLKVKQIIHPFQTEWHLSYQTYRKRQKWYYTIYQTIESNFVQNVCTTGSHQTFSVIMIKMSPSLTVHVFDSKSHSSIFWGSHTDIQIYSKQGFNTLTSLDFFTFWKLRYSLVSFLLPVYSKRPFNKTNLHISLVSSLQSYSSKA